VRHLKAGRRVQRESAAPAFLFRANTVLQRVEKAKEGLLREPIQRREGIAGLLRLTAMKQDGIHYAAGATVMEIELTVAQAHEGFGAVFRWARARRAGAGQGRTHVVEKQIGEERDRLIGECGARVVTRSHFRDMATHTPEGFELFTPLSDLGIAVEFGGGGWREKAHEVDDSAEGLGIDLGVRSRIASLRDRGQAASSAFVGVDRCGQTHLESEGPRSEIRERRDVCFAPETGGLAAPVCSEATGNPVAVAIVGVRPSLEGLHGNRVHEAKSEHEGDREASRVRRARNGSFREPSQTAGERGYLDADIFSSLGYQEITPPVVRETRRLGDGGLTGSAVGREGMARAARIFVEARAQSLRGCEGTNKQGLSGLEADEFVVREKRQGLADIREYGRRI
jgi:hypothetical protein